MVAQDAEGGEERCCHFGGVGLVDDMGLVDVAIGGAGWMS
jgi:hypothetical protein